MKLRSGAPLILFSLLLLLSCGNRKSVTYTGGRNQSVSAETAVNREVDDQIAPYRKVLDEKMNEVIGVSDSAMVKGRPSSSLTSLFADLCYRQGASRMLDSFGLPLHFAVFNYGSIRAGLPKGDITVRHLYEMMPFDNELVVVKLNGGQVARLFDLLASRKGDALSHLQLSISDSGKYLFAWINGKPFDSRKDYYILTSDYLARGGDYFDVLKEGEMISLGMLVRDAMISEIREITGKGEHLPLIFEPRITVDE